MLGYCRSKEKPLPFDRGGAIDSITGFSGSLSTENLHKEGEALS
jgi:hypothetical protein